MAAGVPPFYRRIMKPLTAGVLRLPDLLHLPSVPRCITPFLCRSLRFYAVPVLTNRNGRG